jgi:hypothetical protein
MGYRQLTWYLIMFLYFRLPGILGSAKGHVEETW